MEKLSVWTGLLTNIAVLVGLVFLVVEIDQNTRVQRNDTDVAIHSLAVEASLMVAETRELAELIAKAESTEWNDFSRAEQEQLGNYFAALVTTASLQYGLFRRNDEPIDNIMFPEAILGFAVWSGYWEVDRALFPPEFVSYIDVLATSK